MTNTKANTPKAQAKPTQVPDAVLQAAATLYASNELRRTIKEARRDGNASGRPDIRIAKAAEAIVLQALEQYGKDAK